MRCGEPGNDMFLRAACARIFLGPVNSPQEAMYWKTQVDGAGHMLSEQMDRAESTKFCLSCHIMDDFGKSLHIDDPSYIPAAHFQNNRVPRDQACYTCHTNYTMFGTVTAKMHGLRHLWAQYIGAVPKPEAIKLYDAYNNRECLHCHLGARSFEGGSTHNKVPDRLNLIKTNKLSCISSGCHEFVHDVASLKDDTFWKEKP